MRMHSTSICNFGSNVDYRVGVRIPGEYRMVLNSDETRFGGHGRLDATVRYASQQYGHDGRGHSLLLYLPCRTCVVLAHSDVAQRLDST